MFGIVQSPQLELVAAGLIYAGAGCLIAAAFLAALYHTMTGRLPWL